jgi:hypothetical protein
MITYNLYIHRTLYLSTASSDEAFRVFRRFTGKGHDVKMSFTRSAVRIAA